MAVGRFFWKIFLLTLVGSVVVLIVINIKSIGHILLYQMATGNGKAATTIDAVSILANRIQNTGNATTTRDALSRLANGIQHKAAKLRCELSKLQKHWFQQGTHTSDTGAYCSNSMASHQTDFDLIKGLINLFEGMRVGSFGDGMGVYKNAILKSGRVPVYDAYDGNPYCEDFTNGGVKFLDLGIPQYGLPPYDWIISLEVGEHIPKKYEGQYIDNITRHSKKGIVLSWAPPGQGGYGHVNNQPMKYVIKVLDAHGFRLEETVTKTLKAAAGVNHFQRNVHAFVRK